MDNLDNLIEIIRKNSFSMEPVPTGISPKLMPLKGIRFLFFDVYGTLFISCSGDIGKVEHSSQDSHFIDAFKSAGLRVIREDTGSIAKKLLTEKIKESHQASRKRGILYPEVDILKIWNRVLTSLITLKAVETQRIDRGLLKKISVEYETRSNPVWPMRGLTQLIGLIKREGLRAGIISNAQFYTPLLFPSFLFSNPYEIGFDPELFILSYQIGEAKPSLTLFLRALEKLYRRYPFSEKPVKAEELLYIGNDMLNDILPAKQIGFRTALFAGDLRSLRMRKEIEECNNLEPDIIITDLKQLEDIVFVSKKKSKIGSQ
ncbi:MAG: hypothetical protein DRP87_19340, partial [Spirochaetes bacterium]